VSSLVYRITAVLKVETLSLDLQQVRQDELWFWW